MRNLFKLIRGPKSPNAAILSAFALCGLYFVTWYLISHCFPPSFY